MITSYFADFAVFSLFLISYFSSAGFLKIFNFSAQKYFRMNLFCLLFAVLILYKGVRLCSPTPCKSCVLNITHNFIFLSLSSLPLLSCLLWLRDTVSVRIHLWVKCNCSNLFVFYKNTSYHSNVQKNQKKLLKKFKFKNVCSSLTSRQK